MNKNQWIILGIGLSLLGIFLLWMRGPICLSEMGDLLTACYIRRYSFSISGIILFAFGIIFTFVGLASKK